MQGDGPKPLTRGQFKRLRALSHGWGPGNDLGRLLEWYLEHEATVCALEERVRVAEHELMKLADAVPSSYGAVTVIEKAKKSLARLRALASPEPEKAPPDHLLGCDIGEDLRWECSADCPVRAAPREGWRLVLRGYVESYHRDSAEAHDSHSRWADPPDIEARNGAGQWRGCPCEKCCRRRALTPERTLEEGDDG